MILYTKRLILRPVKMEDAIDIYEYAQLQSVCEMTQDEQHYSIDDTYDSIINFHFKYSQRDAFPTLVIEYQKKVIGLVSLHTKICDYHYELGFELNPQFSNQGIMKEALESYLNSMVNKYEIKKISAITLKINVNSIKLLQKLKFNLISESEDEYYFERSLYEKI